MERYRIALDADGVIVAFNQHIKAISGNYPQELGDVALWAVIEQHPEFWLDTPLFDHAHELVDLCRPYGVRFVTGCPADPVAHEKASLQKKQKLGEAFGIPVVTCRAKDKALYMQEPGDILVDDFIRNIKRWEKAGGRAVYFRSYEQALVDLKNALAEAFPEI